MESATAPTEDSGMIDLKALAAKAESTRPPPLSEIDGSALPVGPAPAQFAAPLGSYAPVASEVAPKSKLPLFFGVGAGILLLLVVGIVIGLNVGSRVAPPPVVGGMASAIALPAVVATAAEPSAAPSASATAEPSESAVPEVASTPKRHRHGGGAAHKLPAGGGAAGATAGDGASANGATATTHAAGAGSTQTAASPKKGDCGCKGDLICMMKCSTH